MTAEPARPLGEIIRTQRRVAQMSLRRLASLSSVSNPYLSQIERGLHEPSFRVLQAVADALDVSVEAMLADAGMLRRRSEAAQEPAPAAPVPAAPVPSAPVPSATERAIDADDRLSPDQKAALLATYRAYVGPARGN